MAQESKAQELDIVEVKKKAALAMTPNETPNNQLEKSYFPDERELYNAQIKVNEKRKEIDFLVGYEIPKTEERIKLLEGRILEFKNIIDKQNARIQEIEQDLKELKGFMDLLSSSLKQKTPPLPKALAGLNFDLIKQWPTDLKHAQYVLSRFQTVKNDPNVMLVKAKAELRFSLRKLDIACDDLGELRKKRDDKQAFADKKCEKRRMHTKNKV